MLFPIATAEIQGRPFALNSNGLIVQTVQRECRVSIYNAVAENSADMESRLRLWLEMGLDR